MHAPHRAALAAENRRLKAAIAAIHDLLHKGEVDAAHEACECAMDGGQVSQPSLDVNTMAAVHEFAVDFNRLCERRKVLAACISFIPLENGKHSVQLNGQVDACKWVEAALGGKSTYMGEHGSSGNGE